MIRVFFNEDGYYVTGENIEIARRCSPALTVHGNLIFPPLHHTYKICFMALSELSDFEVEDDVMVYSDSRIIDEINGILPPIDDISKEWITVIRRYSLPNIRAVVFFRKKASNEINQSVSKGHTALIKEVDDKTLAHIMDESGCKKNIERRNERILKRLRKIWFGENNE